MPITCSICGKVIVYSGERPSFCAYCGNPLRGSSVEHLPAAEPTVEFQPGPDPDSTVSSNAIKPSTGTAPELIGGYRLLRMLGSGGMGSVYEAEDCANGRRVAMKLLNSQQSATGVALDRFRQEGRLASLISHPRCVFVLAAEEEAGRPYIVMELMPGTTLRDLVERDGPLSPNVAIEKILVVIDGLMEAHRLNILHRDVKPSNCFLMPDGRVKIGDFGLSKSLHGFATNLTQSGAFLGTVLYASPEQIRGEPLNYCSDVYSVCATLYYLLTGRPPFLSDNPTAVIARVISEPPPPLRAVRPGVSPRLEKIVLRGLDRNRDRRWQSLAELRAAQDELRPKPASAGGLGMRFAAYLIDLIVLMPLAFAGSALLDWYELPTEFAGLILAFTYFNFFLEGTTGWSVGKWCLRFRLTCRDTVEPPTRLQSGVRVVTFILLTDLYSLAAIADRATGLSVLNSDWSWLLTWLSGVVGLILPMAFGRGYRGGARPGERYARGSTGLAPAGDRANSDRRTAVRTETNR